MDSLFLIKKSERDNSSTIRIAFSQRAQCETALNVWSKLSLRLKQEQIPANGLRKTT